MGREETTTAEDESRIARLLGAETLHYLQKKHRGGVSGSKGVRYEDVFAVVQIAQAAREFGRRCEAVRVEAQVPLRFVDDLLVSDEPAGVRRYHQLKNSASVAWGAGLRSIAGDFSEQMMLSRKLGEGAIQLILVVADPELAKRLEADIPGAIQDHARVVWFPWEDRLLHLCERWSPELSALAWLSKHSEPTFHDLYEVLGILCGSWAVSGGRTSALDLIEAARRSSPTLIRPLAAPEHVECCLAPEFVATLARIENFSYSIVKGFFAWEARHSNGSVSSGVLAHDCLSESFKAFQSRMVKLAPSTFESMEDQLL